VTTHRLKDLPTWLQLPIVTAAYAWSIGWGLAGLPFAACLGIVNTIGKTPLHLLGLPVPGEPTVEQVGGRHGVISPWSFIWPCAN